MRAMKRLAPLVAVTLAGFSLFPLAGHGATVKPPPPPAHTDHTHPEHASAVHDLAAHGDRDAQYQVALALLKASKPTPKARADAQIWLELSAINGQVHAALLGAKLYEDNADIKRAAPLWYRAGQLGDATAREHFVDLVLTGKIQTLGGRDGATWVTARVNATHSRAGKMILGRAFHHGDGIPPDRVQAEKWYLDAAEDGDAQAMIALGRLQLADPAVWRAPDKEVDNDGHRLGPSLWPVRWSARNRGGSGRLDLGRDDVAAGLNLNPDRLVLIRPGMIGGQSWLERAQTMGFAQAGVVLAAALSDGMTLPMDLYRASQLRQAAACAGDRQAAIDLAKDAAAEHNGTVKDGLRAWVYWDVAIALSPTGTDTAQLQAERDRIGKTLAPKQSARAKQISQDWCGR